jgi:iron(III) transport system permease protein
MSASVCLNENIMLTGRRAVVTRVIQKLFTVRLVAMGTALFTTIPILVILASFLHPEPAIWDHIIDTILKEMVVNTVILSAGVISLTAVLGVGAAWLTSVCNFPGRSFFSWALLLPLAVPTYVFAFVFIGLLDFSGPIQTFARDNLPLGQYRFPEIRSAWGVIFVMSLALYPYVYLLARNAFRTQGTRVMEVASVMGYGQKKAFFNIALPMARPWIVSGLMLVLMETLADFGAVSIFNYDTLSTGIYKCWFGFFSLSAAAQLSSVLLAVMCLAVFVEQRMRARIRYHQVGMLSMETPRIQLEGRAKWGASFGLGAVFTIGFLIPFFRLCTWGITSLHQELSAKYAGLLIRSVVFAGTATVVITILGLTLAYVNRRYKDPLTSVLIRLSTMGYALPGTVLAVGIVIMVTAFDRQLTGMINLIPGIRLSSIVQGTIITVIFAYTVRFMTVGFNSINSSMQRLTPSLDEAARIQGVVGFRLLGKIHMPMLRRGLLTAAILVFVDVMKEMPITLMTRPFGWDTLAVKIFELTSEGEWERAALPSLCLVITGMIPLMVLTRKSD